MSAEQEPSLPLTLSDGRKMEMTPANSTLYTFLGKTAVKRGEEKFEIENSSLNHVFLALEKNKGLYFFASHDEPFAQMAKFMVEHSFPMVLHQRTVPECDLKVWVAEVDKIATEFAGNIPDSLPDN